MNIMSVRKMVQEIVSAVHFIDADIPDNIEGECNMWQRDDCTFLLEFAQMPSNQQELYSILNNINTQMLYLEQEYKIIAHLVKTQNSFSLNFSTLTMQYVAFWIESPTEVFCDFALTATEWGEKWFECSLEHNNQLLFHGFQAASI